MCGVQQVDVCEEESVLVSAGVTCTKHSNFHPHSEKVLWYLSENLLISISLFLLLLLPWKAFWASVFFSFCLYSKLSNCLLVGLCPTHRDEHKLEIFSKTPTVRHILNEVNIWWICQNKAHETRIISSYQISPTLRISKWNRIINRYKTEREDVQNLGHWFWSLFHFFPNSFTDLKNNNNIHL